MQVQLSERVKTILHTISPEERQKILVWFDYLRNWEEDPFARSRSVLLDVQGRSVYLFRTTTDLYIFYTLDPQNNTITVIDVPPEETIRAYRNAAAGGS
jgi:hypothetical protein